jgi:hypothetical protein
MNHNLAEIEAFIRFFEPHRPLQAPRVRSAWDSLFTPRPVREVRQEFRYFWVATGVGKAVLHSTIEHNKHILYCHDTRKLPTAPASFLDDLPAYPILTADGMKPTASLKTTPPPPPPADRAALIHRLRAEYIRATAHTTPSRRHPWCALLLAAAEELESDTSLNKDRTR